LTSDLISACQFDEITRTTQEAALTEPLSCCYSALRSVQTLHNDVVLVIGAGPIGAMHVMLNLIAGAKKIMAADIRQDRLDKISEFGADVTINSSATDLTEAVMEETNGRGADVIITAVSVPEIQTQAVELLASATFPLAEINQAFDYAASGEGLKTVITSE
jgi:threonine dehydrogenase-like Zn-dependent dehydrogenase